MVSVPAGAVSSPTEIFVELLDSDEVPASLASRLPVGGVYRFGPDGLVFNELVEVSFVVDVDELPFLAGLTLITIGLDGRIEELQDVRVEAATNMTPLRLAASNRVRGLISHFSPFATVLAALTVTNESGFVEENLFQTQAVFAPGNEVVYRLTVTNTGCAVATNVELIDAIAPSQGIVECRDLLPTMPGGGANPSVGSISGGTCGPGGFTWAVGMLLPGEQAELFFRAEALEFGDDVNRVTLRADQLSQPVVDEELIAIGGVSLRFDNEDGIIEPGFFSSTKDIFAVGDTQDKFIYRIEVGNFSTFPATNVRIVDAVAPNTGIFECTQILVVGPDGGANPSIGSVPGGNCSPNGFTWDIGRLNPGVVAVILFQAEAMRAGTDVNRVTLTAEELESAVIKEEPTTISSLPVCF